MQLAFFAGNTMIAVGTTKNAEGDKAQGAHIAKSLDEVLRSEQFVKEGYSEVKKIESPEQDFLAVYSRIRGEAAENDVGFALISSVALMSSPTEFYENAGSQDVKALPLVWLIIGVLLIAAFGWIWNYLEAERPLSNLLRSVEALAKADPKDQLNVYKFRRRIRKVAQAVNALVDYKIRALLESSEGTSKNIDSILGSRDSGGRMSSASFKFVEPGMEDSIPPPPPAKPGSEDKKKDKTGSAPPSPSQPLSPADLTTGTQKAPPKPEAKKEPGPEDEQEYFKEIYAQFIALKEKLGEQTAQLTFERFLGTLKKNRDTLVARYGCKHVRFQVYEKNGKASLRATPVKD